MFNLNLYSCFNNLCLRYYDLTVENNKKSTDNQKCVYFKDQFPNVYQEFMKALTLVPNENNINEIAKYYKLDENKECKLIKLLKENGIDVLYDDAEYQKYYKGISDNTKRVYNALITYRFPEEIIYIYLKLLTQKLENISDADKKYLLNYLLSLLKDNTNFKPMKLSDNSESLNNYKTLLPKNELETNEYYQMIYDLLNINYGGCQMGIEDICPLHLNDTQNKNISLNKTNIDSNQISRGINKKLLSDKNYINTPLGFNYNNPYASDNVKVYFGKYITGDKIDSNYINGEMEKIKNKYKLNNTFNINLMGDKLYEEISNIFTKMPYNNLNYISIPSDIVYSSLFIVDKDIDRKYFEGKLSYFAKFIISMKNRLLSPNEKICTEYILTNVLNNQLKLPDVSPDVSNLSLYIMLNYMKDQLNEWLIKIKPLLGLDNKWNYDASKDTIRKKILNNEPKLIEKYDQIMNINYTKIFTLDPLLNNYSNYNIIKTFSDSMDFYITKITSIVGSSSLKQTVDEMLGDIRTESKKNITYFNNTFLDTYGFKSHFKNMLNDINTEQSIKIYDEITMIFNSWNNYIKYSLNNLFNRGIESFYNDYNYMGIPRYNNCPECAKNLYKLYTEGFYKVFEEVNILKQYQNIEQIIAGKVSPSEIFDDNGKLKADLSSIQLRADTEYYYTIDNYCTTSVMLEPNSEVVVVNNNNTPGDIRDNTFNSEKITNKGRYDIELGFNNLIKANSVFTDYKNIIGKIKFYKRRVIKPADIEKNKLYIDLTKTNINSHTLYTVNNNLNYYYSIAGTTVSSTGSSKGIYTSSEDISMLPENMNLLYTDDLSDSKYIGKYLITKEDNYAYPIENKDKLKKLILQGKNNKYIMLQSYAQFIDSAESSEQYYVQVAGSDHIYFGVDDEEKIELYGQGKKLSEDVRREYKSDIMSVSINATEFKPVVLHIEGAKFYYKKDIEDKTTSSILEFKRNGVDQRSINDNNTGYVLFRDYDKKDLDLILLIITDQEKFKQYVTKGLNSISFEYENNEDTNMSEFKSYPKFLDEYLFKSCLILNKPVIKYTSKPDEIPEKGITLDSNLDLYDWKYYIDNVNILEIKNNIYEEMEQNSLKDQDSPKEQHLQKEFMVKDFNKLMLRKCFPNNFKRTLICNQDVLDAVDGGKYSVPNIKIKEALCEYNKYPYYLEHYFMTSKVDYKLKGKFNLRCLANLSGLPNIVFEYLDRDDLDYINKEVIVQGEDMIVKDGKIISSGDVYLVGIELSNDQIFKVPPTRILNKALLNVIDFQQFDNIYSRVELLLNNSGITDYIVKPLTLENIGTLKNMKYINFC